MRKGRNTLKLTTLAATLALLGGCAVGPDYQAQTPDLPEQWPEHALLGPETSEWQFWWTRFNDPTLNALVERALDDNLNLQVQIQRIEQARAKLGLSKANSWPLLSGQANAAREQSSAATPRELGDGKVGNQFTVNGVLSYELDLWGRLAREREAAGAMLAESVFGTEAVRLNLVTDVVTTYFNLRSAEQQLALTRETLGTREETLELERIRHERGASDPLSIRQARAELERTRARLPEQERRLHELRSALAMLVGYGPKEMLAELDFGDGKLTDIELPGSVPEVLPSKLLQRRPDIRAAEQALIAANANIGVARAQRFPSLNLQALVGSVALDSNDLFTAPAAMWRMEADLAGPLFDFGRARSRIESAEAQRARAEAEYQLAITSGFRDVRDALVVYRSTERRVQAMRRQIEATQDMLALAELQYRAGRIGFYELLDAQRNLLDTELTLSQVVSSQLAATATLFKAMGGGWHPAPS